MLCGKCHTPLKNLRWCEHCKKEIAWENIVKGFKKKDGSFFIMTQEALETLKPEKMDSITIKEFVETAEIEMLFINNHYYMLPHKEKDKAFYLFAQALKKSKKVAIGQFVMHEKEHVAAISFYKNMLLLNTLHYSYEIRTVELTEIETIKITKEDLSLALLLINKLTHKKLVLAKYKDTFVEKLKKALNSPKKATKIVGKKEALKTKTKRKSLATSLKESLGK